MAANESDATTSKPQQGAIDKYTEEIANNPDNAGLYYSRGMAYLKSRGTYAYFKNHYDVLAINDFTKAIELNPDYAAAYIHRGVALTSAVEYYGGSDNTPEVKKAIKDYNQAIKIDPTYALAYTNRAIAYNRTEQYDLSLEDSIKSIELNPKDTKPYYVKAYALKKKYKNQDAIETLRALLKISTDPLDYWQAREWIRQLGGTP